MASRKCTGTSSSMMLWYTSFLWTSHAFLHCQLLCTLLKCVSMSNSMKQGETEMKIKGLCVNESNVHLMRIIVNLECCVCYI